MIPNIPDLTAELWGLVCQIPRGKVASYGDVARRLGDVVASRYVGHVMMHHRHGPDCPCHRLVRTDGTLGKFVTGQAADKLRALQAEGVEISGGQVHLASHRFTHFESHGPPLARLAQYQHEAAEQARRAAAWPAAIRRCGGVDVSYVPGTNRAVAAFVEVAWASREVSYQKLIARPVEFPYVTSYLAFRELPILCRLLSLVREERSLPDVVLVDGSGILHPRRAGIATMLGVACEVPTIGVTKKHLAGRVDSKRLRLHGCCPVHLDDQASGVALLPGSGTNKPLYISPGLGIDVATSHAVVQQALHGRRLPEPIYWADRLSREAAKEGGQ